MKSYAESASRNQEFPIPLLPNSSKTRELIAKAGRTSLNGRVQFEFNLKPVRPSMLEGFLTLTDRQIPLALIRNLRARRYVLRLRSDGSARVTIPRGGSIVEARRFAERHVAWLERGLQRLSMKPTRPMAWTVGTEIYFRGEQVMIEAGEGQSIRFGSEIIRVTDPTGDVGRLIERHLWRLASAEFPPMVLECAALHQVSVRRVTVRNQKSRWGSCSCRGTVSLNWRLIQAPAFVWDYLILHELMHLREMNHSRRFWRHVEQACPDYEMAERWLKEHSGLLVAIR